MTSPALESWLRQRFRSEAVLGILVGLATLTLGLLVMIATFWMAYGAAWVVIEGVSALSEIVGSRQFRIPHEGRLVCAGAFLALLFLSHLRTSPWDRGDYSYFGDPEAAMRMRVAETLFPRRFGEVNSIQRLLVHPGASSRMIAEILETGPRCLTGAWAMLCRATSIFRYWRLRCRTGRSKHTSRRRCSRDTGGPLVSCP
jgi:hypothetical protein